MNCPNIKPFSRLSLIFMWAMLLFNPVILRAADLGQTVSSAADQAAQTIDETSRAAVGKIEQLWNRVDQQRLKNRTPDEIVAWVLMGLLVGGALANFMKMNRAAALGLGLLGSFIGGIVAHLTQVNLGLGPVLIRYEDLLFSLGGSLLAVFAIRLLMKRKQAKKQ